MSDGQELQYEIVEENDGAATGKNRKGRRTKAMIADALGAEAAEVEAEIARDRRLSVVDEMFGDGQGYDRTRLEVEVQTHLRSSALSYLQAGNRLVQLKEHEQHGLFMESLEKIGLDVSVADKMMLTARKLQGTKLANSDSHPNLLPTKLYEIALLDQEQIDELDQTGATGAVSLDEIQRMTTREAKAALREARQKHRAEIEALEQVVKKKNEIINKQELQISLRPEPSELQVIDGKLKALAVHFISECVKLQVAMRQMKDTLDEAARLPGLALYKARLGDFRDEIVRYGTEAVIAQWEELTNEVENLSPKSELPDVPPLG